MTTNTLNRPALVLNRNWQPVGVSSVARALVKVWNDTARIVDPVDYQQYNWLDWSRLTPEDGEPFIKTRRFRLRVPEVVTLTKYDRLPVNSVTFSRLRLAVKRGRHRGKCRSDFRRDPKWRCPVLKRNYDEQPSFSRR